jgi:hypothetical protein
VLYGSINSSMAPATTTWERLSHGFQLSSMLQAYSALPLNITSGVTTVQGTAGRPVVNGAYIERNAGELTTGYVEDIRRDPRMPSYQGFDQKEIYRRAFRVYSQLGKWISHETSKEEVQSYWTALGRQRRREGFPFSEIALSLCHIRRLLWGKIQAAGLLETALDLYQAMDLYHRVIVFFDRAIYYAAVGYEERD